MASIGDQLIRSFSNSGGALPAGALVASTGLDGQAAAALAGQDFNILGAVQATGTVAAGAPSMTAVTAGLAGVLLETGLSPANGQVLWLSQSTAGRATNIRPTIGVPVGVIVDASTYGSTSQVQAVISPAAALAVANSSTADWDLALVRYFFVDNDNGDDSNVGFIDAAAGSTFSAAQSAAVAIRTLEQLRNILPRNGAGRSFVALIKPRSDAGNYLNKSGANDYLDVGYGGYIYQAFRGSDLTNNANDFADMGGVVAEAGPNADQSFTVNTYNGGTFELTVNAGPLGSSNTIAGLKVQWAGNVTAALRTIGNMAHFQNNATSLNLAADLTAPANGDQFFLMRPGVQVTDIRGNGYPPASVVFSGTPPNMNLLAGIECTSGFTARNLGRFKLAFVRFAGSTTFDGTEIEASGTYATEAGGFQIQSAGVDARGSLTVRKANIAQVQVSAFHGGTTRFQSIAAPNVGEGCYSNSAPLFRGCGAFGARPGVTFNTDNTVGSMNPATKAGFRCPAGIQIESSGLNVGGIDLDGSTGSVELIGVCDLNMRDFRGTTTAAYVLDLTAAYKSRVVILAAGAGAAATADVVLPGSAPASFDDLATTNVVDENGNDLQGTAGHVVSECVLVSNQSGTALAAGDAVKSNGTTNQVTEAQATTDAESARVHGIMVTAQANGSPGYMATGPTVVANFDGAPTVGAIAYVSPGTTAALTTTVPAVAGSNQKLRAGRVLDVVSGTLARVMWHPENLAVAADGNP